MEGYSKSYAERERQNEVLVDKAQLAKFGSKQFEECVKLVSRLPHVKSLNLPLCSELGGAIFWRAKCTMMEVIWGGSFEKHFPFFSRNLEAVKKKKSRFGRRSVHHRIESY